MTLAEAKELLANIPPNPTAEQVAQIKLAIRLVVREGLRVS